MPRLRVRVLYLAHPVSGDVAENCARARRWLKFLMDQLPNVAICCPWLPMIDVSADDGDAATRALRDDVEIARRCDGILLCGGAVTSGMEEERDGCADENGEVFDLTDLGAEPPTDPRLFDVDTTCSTTSGMPLSTFCMLEPS